MAPLAGAQMRTDGVYIGGNRIITTTVRAISDPDRRQYDRHSGAHRDCIAILTALRNAWPDRLMAHCESYHLIAPHVNIRSPLLFTVQLQ
jgi:hypothetical protein